MSEQASNEMFAQIDAVIGTGTDRESNLQQFIISRPEAVWLLRDAGLIGETDITDAVVASGGFAILTYPMPITVSASTNPYDPVPRTYAPAAGAKRPSIEVQLAAARVLPFIEDHALALFDFTNQTIRDVFLERLGKPATEKPLAVMREEQNNFVWPQLSSDNADEDEATSLGNAALGLGREMCRLRPLPSEEMQGFSNSRSKNKPHHHILYALAPLTSEEAFRIESGSTVLTLADLAPCMNDWASGLLSHVGGGDVTYGKIDEWSQDISKTMALTELGVMAHDQFVKVLNADYTVATLMSDVALWECLRAFITEQNIVTSGLRPELVKFYQTTELTLEEIVAVLSATEVPFRSDEYQPRLCDFAGNVTKNGGAGVIAAIGSLQNTGGDTLVRAGIPPITIDDVQAVLALENGEEIVARAIAMLPNVAEGVIANDVETVVKLTKKSKVLSLIVSNHSRIKGNDDLMVLLVSKSKGAAKKIASRGRDALVDIKVGAAGEISSDHLNDLDARLLDLLTPYKAIMQTNA